MKNNKWSVESFSSKPIYVVLFCSRNKDNKHLEDFKERRMSFITHKTIEELETDFNDFISHGRDGEMCRMYYSANERDGEKIYRQLIHFLFDTPDFNLCSIAPKLAGIAAQKECAKTKRWMFDFDSSDEYLLQEFLEDVCLAAEDVELRFNYIQRTPHGYAVVVNKGFDTRELLAKWGNIVTLKRDDLLCVKWKTKGEEHNEQTE